MFELNLWQVAMIVGTSVLCVGVMAWAIRTVLGSPADSPPALARRASALESALVDSGRADGGSAFDVFAYRVAARFAGKTRIVVDGDVVAVSGPRVPRQLYAAWLWVQGVLLALVPAFAVWAAVTLEWGPLGIAAATLLLSCAISAAGAGLWPGLGEMEFVSHGAYQALEFPRTAVSDVTIGEGWARGGMEVLLLPYKKGVDALAEGRCVSFFGPDERGRKVRYALHCPEKHDAHALADLLSAGQRAGDSLQ